MVSLSAIAFPNSFKLQLQNILFEFKQSKTVGFSQSIFFTIMMNLTKNKKEFDCLECKKQAQEKIYEDIKNLSLAEQITDSSRINDNCSLITKKSLYLTGYKSWRERREVVIRFCCRERNPISCLM